MPSNILKNEYPKRIILGIGEWSEPSWRVRNNTSWDHKTPSNIGGAPEVYSCDILIKHSVSFCY